MTIVVVTIGHSTLVFVYRSDSSVVASSSSLEEDNRTSQLSTYIIHCPERASSKPDSRHIALMGRIQKFLHKNTKNRYSAITWANATSLSHPSSKLNLSVKLYGTETLQKNAVPVSSPEKPVTTKRSSASSSEINRHLKAASEGSNWRLWTSLLFCISSELLSKVFKGEQTKRQEVAQNSSTKTTLLTSSRRSGKLQKVPRRTRLINKVLRRNIRLLEGSLKNQKARF